MNSQKTQSYSGTAGFFSLDHPPYDTVADLCFSQSGNLLLASSWDGTARVWEVNDQGGTKAPFIHIETEKSVPIRGHFSSNNQLIFLGTTKGEIKTLPVETQTATVLGKHDNPVTGLRFNSNHNVLVTGCMDGMIRFWDPLSKSAVGSQASMVGEIVNEVPIVNIDTGGDIVYIAIAGGSIYSIDVRADLRLVDCHSRLSSYSQITSIACPRDGSGYIAGTVTGHVELSLNTTQKEILRSHRSEQQRILFPCNFVAVSPEHPACASVGGDGIIYFYNPAQMKVSKEQRVASGSQPYALTACAFSRQGMFACAQGYDWSKGAEEFGKFLTPIHVFMRRIGPADFTVNQGRTSY